MTEIRHAPLPEGASPEAPLLDRRTMVVLVLSTILLIVFWHWGRPGPFINSALHEALQRSLGDRLGDLTPQLPYHWWGLSSVVWRIVVPFGVVVFVFREPLSEWGWRATGQLRHAFPYLAFFAAMVPILFVVSQLPSFQHTYPFYGFAYEGGWQFWGYQLSYGVQFLGVEAFFRGFMLFGLERRLGWYAVPVMVIPYVMIHFGKPWPEVFAAVVAGFLLGWMALRSRSFLWGAALHWAVALTMDFFVMGHRLGFGEALGRIF